MFVPCCQPLSHYAYRVKKAQSSGTSRHQLYYTFDLIELDGDDLRRDPLAVRNGPLASLLSRAAPELRFNKHLDMDDGPPTFAHRSTLRAS
jgi:ATP-dependent DNA ligase